MNSLAERIKWILIEHRGADAGLIADHVLREIESTHRIINPDYVDDKMLEASFAALPECYDPPDPKRKPWHGFKAQRRYTAMVRAAPKIHQEPSSG